MTSAPAQEAAPEVPQPLRRGARLWLDHLRVERGHSAHTVAAYRRDLERYLRYLAGHGVTRPGEATEAQVAAYLTWLRTPTPERPALAPSSAARALVAVRGWHRFLALEGETASDPAREVGPPPPPRRLPKALSLEQVESLLQAASVGETPAALRDRALLEVLYATGARVSEAVGLDLDDVDLPPGERGGVVRLLGKGRKERLVPLGGYAREALEAWLVRGRPELARRGRGQPAAAFVNARGGRLSRQSAWRVLRAAAERAGLAGRVSPHTLRHSFATHLLDGGADVRVVQELLGHASVTTTQVYTLVTVQHLREVYAQAHPRAR